MAKEDDIHGRYVLRPEQAIERLEKQRDALRRAFENDERAFGSRRPPLPVPSADSDDEATG